MRKPISTSNSCRANGISISTLGEPDVALSQTRTPRDPDMIGHQVGLRRYTHYGASAHAKILELLRHPEDMPGAKFQTFRRNDSSVIAGTRALDNPGSGAGQTVPSGRAPMATQKTMTGDVGAQCGADRSLPTRTNGSLTAGAGPR